MKKSMLLVLLIILISFALAIYMYPKMPERVASHWNAQGNVDGYMPRTLGIFLMPIITLGMLLLFLLIPRIDPLKKNIEKFRKYFDWFIVLFILFMFYIYLLSLLWNIGFRFNMSNMMIPAMGILFFYIGVLTENAKMNWFIGIRTPWTLSNEKVWNKTHKIGGLLFKIAGVLALIGVFFQEYAILFVLIPVCVLSVYLVFYSYFEYQKQARKKK